MAGSELVGVVVSVSDGVVTMRGSVANAAAALRAEAAVRGVSGVKSVRNDLLVRGAAGY
jgi:osmotically-inducible protein OsmY